MEYIPDKWVVVDYSSEYSPAERYAILAGWGGSFIYGASWKRSSGIIFVTLCDSNWEVTTYSGSVYILRKNSIGYTGVTAQLAQEAELSVVDSLEEITKVFNSLKESSGG